MKSFKKICRQNYIRIYNYIYAMTREAFLAEDLTQEVFLIAWQKGEDFMRHEKPEAFLYKTAKIKVLETLREEKRNESLELQENMAVDRRDLFDELIWQGEQEIDEQEYMKQVLSQLTDEQKELYQSYYVEHKPMREIAREKRIRESALKMKYVRLRKAVRNIVMDLGLSDRL
ncbi:MAG: RNA polymerase sigma factor [Clostridia bacterium]